MTTVCFAFMTIVCSLIRLEMSPSKNRSPSQDAEGVSPPLLVPPPLRLESNVPPEGGSCCTWANHLQHAQQKPCLATDSTDRQGLSEEGGYQGDLCLLGSHLAPPTHLGSSISDSCHCQVMEKRVQVVRGLAEGADHDAMPWELILVRVAQ